MSQIFPPCHSNSGIAVGNAVTRCKECDFKDFCKNFNKLPQPAITRTGASDEQFGGDHYKKMKIQVWDVVDTWPRADRIAYYRGNALKYIMRLNDKDAPITNAEKAAHYCRKLAEVLSEA